MNDEKSGWIKLHRQTLAGGWLQNPELWTFWCYCLLKATHKRHTARVGYQRLDISSGQFVFGRKKAAEELKTTERKIRTSLKTLEIDGNVTIKTTNKFSVITICNWEAYQSNGITDDQQTTNKRPTNDQQTTTYKNNKEDLFLLKDTGSLKELFLSLNKKIHPKRLCIETNGHLAKLRSRLKHYNKKEILEAANNMISDPFMMGDNNNQKKYASLEYLLRNDENVRKCLDKAPGKVSRLMKNLDVDNLED